MDAAEFDSPAAPIDDVIARSVEPLLAEESATRTQQETFVPTPTTPTHHVLTPSSPTIPSNRVIKVSVHT